jgi:Asp-tRNA(Asn)/Glu-tRNA(Gln) amidotransferase A subunit family amidase
MAWVQLLPQNPTGTGALSGVPFGVKDVIETRGLATEYGSAIYKGRIGTADAAIVRQLRQRGGVLLGKTHTTAFAYTTPAPTHNPRNLAHTPGGSSSGSAAAVAAGMVPIALGTQTGGSTIYDEARRYIAESKTRMSELFKATPVILTPAAMGPAPLGLASTGDSRLNSPWTTPAITIPMPVGSALPLGLQLTADHGQDARVIRTAVKLERLLSAQASVSA